MATISNIIQTIFTSLGEGEVIGATERVGRAQTRLGQASASSGRAFAAQASGLGGLVGAYAGAAATVFALEAAFTALAQSARAAQTIEGVGSLAAIAGQEGKAIVNSIKEITKGQLTLTEAAQQASLSLSAGFNSEQIEGLSEVALKASRALGRDLTDAYTRVVRGSAKLETELLDELGIYTKIEPATRAYAAALGKSRLELTEYERRQAFVNAVIEEGQRKFQAINTTIPTSAEQIEAFGATIVDLATQFGSFLADVLAPLAAYLTDNVAGALSVVGLAASLAASKGVGLLSSGFDILNTKIIAFGAGTEKVIRAFTLTAAAASNANIAIKALTMSQIKLTGAQATQLGSLITTANTRKLNTLELKESQKLIGQNITALRAERAAFESSARAQIAAYRAAKDRTKIANQALTGARAMSQGGGFGTPAFIARTTAINRANRELRLSTDAQNSLRTATEAAITSLRSSTAALNANAAAARALTPALRGAGAAFAAFGAGAAKVAAGIVASYAALIGGIVRAASSILSITSLVTLFGSSIAGALGKGEEFNTFMKELGTTVKQFFSDAEGIKAKKVFKGVTVGALSEIEKVDAALRETDSFTFKKKFLFFEVEVEKSKENLVNEINSIMSDAASGAKRTFTDGLGRGGLIGGAIGAALPAVLSLIPGIGIPATLLAKAFIGAFTTAAGTAIGAWVDSTLFSEAYDPDKVEDIKKQFANQLSAFDNESQDILARGLATLEERYAKAAKVDPRARAVLTLQRQLIFASGKYLKNMESITQLMVATGQTADQIVIDFDVTSVKNQIDSIQTAISSLDTNIRFNFIDTEAQAKSLTDSINKSIANTFGKINISSLLDFKDLDSVSAEILPILKKRVSGEKIDLTGITDEAASFIRQIAMNKLDLPEVISKLEAGFVNFESTLRNVANASNLTNQSSARLDFTQRNLTTAIRESDITLEQFGLSLAAVNTAQTVSRQQYFALEKEINSLSSKQVDALLLQGIDTAAILADARNNLITQQGITKELKKQEAIIANQATISDFLKSFTKDKKNPLSFELEFITESASNNLESFIGQVEYLSGFVSSVSANLGNTLDAELEKYRTNAEALRDLPLGDSLKANILTTGIEDLIVTEGKEVSASLAEIQAQAEKAGATITQSGNQLVVSFNNSIEKGLNATVSLQSKATTNQLALYDQAIEAIQGLTQEAVNNLPKFIGAARQEYSKIIDQINIDLKNLESQERVLKLQFEIDKSAIQQQIVDIQSNAVIARLESDIEITEAKKDLKQISPVEAANKVAEIERQILSERQDILTLTYSAELQALEDRRTLLGEESEIRKQAIAAEAELQINKVAQDVAYVNAITTAYSTFIVDSNKVNNQLVQDFVAAGNAIAQNFATTLQNGGTSIGNAIMSALAQNFSGAAGAVATQPAAITTTAIESTLKREALIFRVDGAKAINKIREGTRASIAAEEIATARALELIGMQEKAATARYEAEFEALTRAAELGDLVAQRKLADAKAAGGGGGKDKKDSELDYVDKKLQELFDSIKGNIESAIMSLNDLIFYGEGNFGDIIGNLFKSIQQDLFKQTVADPLSGFLTDSIFSALGVTGMRTGIENAKVENGALLVKLVTGPADLFNIDVTKPQGAKDSILNTKIGTDKLADGTKGIFGGFFDQITSLFSNIFGPAGILSTLFKGLMGEGGILSGLFKGIGGFFGSILGFSQGGLVHLAAGGAAVSASLNRDRVPAMLEPGEFVLRKQSASRIGMPALQAMNATGEAGGSGNVYVNVVNEGSPKQAEASAPRFDGEKYVIDVVMRDIANNGPIRRTLRGRGGV